MRLMPMTHYPTSSKYSVWDQLPAPLPSDTVYLTRHFYENTAKHLIKDTVRIMNNGLNIDLEKVMELQDTLDTQLEDVQYRLSNNPLVKTFMKGVNVRRLEEFIEDRKDKLRSPEYYLKPFDPSKQEHRSYFMELYAKEQGMESPEEVLKTINIPKWSAALVKKLSTTRPVLKRLLDKSLSEDHPLVQQTIKGIAQLRSDTYNKSFLAQIENPNIDYPDFNPGSSQQKQALFEWLGIEPLAFSKDTGLPSWGRDQVEEINKTTVNADVRQLTQAFIDHSYAGIVRNNFIEAFYKYTINGRLYGQYKLLGAKTGRYTSSNPNMLNMPSTGSIFAKPIKECFTAPEGFLIAGIDYSALEDRVVANLSKDDNKLGLFLEGLDGHSLSATYYYPDRVAALVGHYIDHKEASRKLKKLVDEGNKEAKDVRQDSKPISFGLAYGAYPPKVAATVKISIDEATSIFNAYHGELYPGITRYREDYVLPTTAREGQIHTGLGFTLKSDNPDRDIRTLNNACSQFWSILTALTINKMHQLIDAEGLENDIIVTSTIYDSIYFEVRNDPTIIKWLNDNIVPIMEQDFIEDQIVHNSANLEIGTSWADLVELGHNTSVEDIKKVIESFIDK